MSNWRLDSSCVTVDDVTEKCHECEADVATKAVMLDLGSQVVAISPRLCQGCAEELAEEVRSTLPAASMPSDEIGALI